MRYTVLCALVCLTGCATNGIEVREITPDGGSLEVRQYTRSTWGSKTDEGAGDFVYTGIAPDGSEFDMRAGSAVTGQQSQDPVESVRYITELISSIAKIMAGAPPATETENAE